MRITILLVMISFACSAQEFKKFRLGFGIGRASEWSQYSGEKTTSAIFYLEPSYRITDRIAVGLRMESGKPGMFLIGSGGISTSSYLVTGQYYFSNKFFRPFAGIGVGVYNSSLSEGTSGFSSLSRVNTFGFCPRIGFDAGHVTMTVDYNIVNSSSTRFISYDHSTGEAVYTEGELKAGYMSVKIGMTLFGGRKKQ